MNKSASPEFGKEKGFTLLEVLVATTIIAAGLLAAASMQGTALTANSTANRLSVATMIAQRAMEEIAARGSTETSLNTSTPGSPPGFVDYDFDPDPLVTSNTVTVPAAGVFTAFYKIQVPAEINGTPLNESRRIDVMVTYGDNKAVSLYTIR